MTTLDATPTQIALPTFKIDIAVRSDDAQVFGAREDAYALIGDGCQQLVEDGFSFDVDEFFSWAVCQEMCDLDGRRTRTELAARIPALKGFVMRDLPVLGGDMRLIEPPGAGTVEYIGVGLGLMVLDRLLQLDPSYFRRIPETSDHKTLDFEGSYRASTGAAYIQVETRGRVDGNNRQSAWDGIEKKKLEFRNGILPQKTRDGPLTIGAPTHLVGTVAEIPLKRSGTARLVIGDPPIPAFEGDPERARFLQRMRFYQRALSAFRPRGALLAALSERIGVLQEDEVNWRKLNKKRLINWRMSKWELSTNVAITIRRRARDQVHGRPVIPLRQRKPAEESPIPYEEQDTRFFFIGLHRDVLLALARQDFDEIANRRFESARWNVVFNGAQRTILILPSGLVISSLIDELDEQASRSR